MMDMASAVKGAMYSPAYGLTTPLLGVGVGLGLGLGLGFALGLGSGLGLGLASAQRLQGRGQVGDAYRVHVTVQPPVPGEG